MTDSEQNTKSLNPQAAVFVPTPTSKASNSSPAKKQAWVSKTKLAKQNSPQSAPATAPASAAQRFDFAKTPKGATFAKGPDWRQQTSQTPTSHGFSRKKAMKVDTSLSCRAPNGPQTAPAGSLNFGFQKTNLKEIKHVCRGCNKVLNSSLQLVEHQNGRTCPANRGLISPQAASVAATPVSQPVANPFVGPHISMAPAISPMASSASNFHELAVTTPTNSVMSVSMKLNSLITLVVEQHGKLKSAIELINSQSKEIQELKQKVASMEKQSEVTEENALSTPVNVVSVNQSV